jgi:bleomycin hydrolase
MKHILLLAFTFIISISINAQYNFEHIKEISCTPIKNQQRTGTCWSFSTASFIESELLRTGKGEFDLSEMFVVRNIYKDKAFNYVLRQGKANFSQGSLAHDLLRIIAKNGIVLESVYSGKLNTENLHDHSELEKGLKGFLDGIMKGKKLTQKWPNAFESILDAYLGEVPSEFEYNGRKFTPQSFAEYLELDTKDYVNITSFSHRPFGSNFILEIPDNYSNGSFFNMELNELVANVDHALNNGYSIEWDGDVSEKGFSSSHGLAILPEDIDRNDLWSEPGKEIAVNQENRQQNFENYSTTDDHLMHLVGIAKDENGGKYYIVKNSWGEKGKYKGFLYMSESYFKMKTVSVTIHRSGLIKDIEF